MLSTLPYPIKALPSSFLLDFSSIFFEMSIPYNSVFLFCFLLFSSKISSKSPVPQPMSITFPSPTFSETFFCTCFSQNLNGFSQESYHDAQALKNSRFSSFLLIVSQPCKCLPQSSCCY